MQQQSYAFWKLNGSIKLKVSENDNIHVITYNDEDDDELFLWYG